MVISIQRDTRKKREYTEGESRDRLPQGTAENAGCSWENQSSAGVESTKGCEGPQELFL